MQDGGFWNVASGRISYGEGDVLKKPTEDSGGHHSAAKRGFSRRYFGMEKVFKEG